MLLQKKCTQPEKLNLLTSTINVIHGLSSRDKTPLDHQWCVHPLVHMQLYKEFSSSWEAEAAAAAMLRRIGREGPEEGGRGRTALGVRCSRCGRGPELPLVAQRDPRGAHEARPPLLPPPASSSLHASLCLSRGPPRGRDLGAPAASRLCGAAAVCRPSSGAPGPRGGSAASRRARPTHAGFIFRKS